MVSFTGSTHAGRRVTALGATTVEGQVTLELGGKSATLVLPDADLARAVTGGAHDVLLELRADLQHVDPAAGAPGTAGRGGRGRLGCRGGLQAREPLRGLDTSRTGPASAAQGARVRAYIQKGIDEGAKLLVGGVEPPVGLETGYFVCPTVFSDVRRDMTIAQEEIFGPVLSIIPYDGEDEAVEIANDSAYGLSGSVWSAAPPAHDRGRTPHPRGSGRHQRSALQPLAVALRRLQSSRAMAANWADSGSRSISRPSPFSCRRWLERVPDRGGGPGPEA